MTDVYDLLSSGRDEMLAVHQPLIDTLEGFYAYLGLYSFVTL